VEPARASGSQQYVLSPAVAEQLRSATAEDAKLVRWIEGREEQMFARAKRRMDSVADRLLAAGLQPAPRTNMLDAL
jgi:hypothetical protein